MNAQHQAQQETWSIGDHTFRNPWILAPMAGVSEKPYRVLALRHGACAAPTELVSAKGLIYGQARTERYLARDESIEEPFWLQIFGGDTENMARAAGIAAERGASILDINMGCPVKKVTKNGAGSALLSDPHRVGQMIERMRSESGLPVTIKIRSGWDSDHVTAIEIGKVAQDAGASLVALHARTRAQGYEGHANWELIRELVEALRIPVIGNGDAWNARRAIQMKKETGCAAVMIGRGALGNPWIFKTLSEPGYLPSCSERTELILEHLRSHTAFVGDELRAVRRFRSHLSWYCTGLAGAANFRREIFLIDCLQQVIRRIVDYFQDAAPVAGAREAIQDETSNALG